jgi:hypothetical protein
MVIVIVTSKRSLLSALLRLRQNRRFRDWIATAVADIIFAAVVTATVGTSEGIVFVLFVEGIIGQMAVHVFHVFVALR